MKNTIIICVGISGSGKSTWSTQYIKENPNILRINRDSIRKTLVGSLDRYYQRKDLNTIEVMINSIENHIFLCINDIKNVIIDNTNLKQSYINKWIRLSQDLDIYQNIKFKLFDISLEEAKKRVYMRDIVIGEGEVEDALNDSDHYLFNAKLDYIKKQFEDYQKIKLWIETNYKDKII